MQENQEKFNFQKLNPARFVSAERVRRTTLTEKYADALWFFLGREKIDDNEMTVKHLGFLDYLGFIIVRGLAHVAFQCVAWGKNGDLPHWAAKLLMGLLAIFAGLLAIPYLLLTGILMMVSAPFIFAVHQWIGIEKSLQEFIKAFEDSWGLDPNNFDNAIQLDEGQKQDITVDQKTNTAVKSLFLSPFPWLLGSVTALGLSSFIQVYGASVFVDAAAPLLLMQGVLVATASLLFISTALYAGHLAVSWLYARVKPLVKETYVAEPETNYLAEHIAWLNSHPWAYAVYAMGFLGIVLVLVLSIGFFVNPMTFGFMQVVFDFTSTGFVSGFQTIAGYPGLEFLGSVSQPTLVLAGQIVSAVMMVITPIALTSTLVQVARMGIGELDDQGGSSGSNGVGDQPERDQNDGMLQVVTDNAKDVNESRAKQIIEQQPSFGQLEGPQQSAISLQSSQAQVNNF